MLADIYPQLLAFHGLLRWIVLAAALIAILVAFAGGLLFFGEGNGGRKFPAIVGVLLGIILTVVG